jgi:hypothetical protein
MFKLSRVLALCSIAAAIAISLAPAVHAGNTNFLTERNGAITFPLSPPNRASSLPGAIDNMTIGATTPAAGTFSQLIPGGTSAPTITSGTCGTGANGTISGSNQTGRITIGAVATTACPVVFSPVMAVAPKSCTLTPGNAAAAASGTAGGFTGAPSTTGFTLTGLALASTVWNYQCF